MLSARLWSPFSRRTTMRPFIAYDLDGTFFRLALFTHVLEAMVNHGSLPPEMVTRIRESDRLWRSRQISYDGYLQATIDALDIWLKQGHPRDLLQSLAQEALAPRIEEVHAFTRSLLRAAQALEYATIAITHSPNESAGVFARHWGFTHIFGSTSAVDERGHYTGARELENKPHALKRVVEQEGYARAGSIGVGDTESDIAMISDTEHPIAFNPTAELLKRMRDLPHGLVVQERKNVCTIIGFEQGKTVTLNEELQSAAGTTFLPAPVLTHVRQQLAAASYTLLIV